MVTLLHSPKRKLIKSDDIIVCLFQKRTFRNPLKSPFYSYHNGHVAMCLRPPGGRKEPFDWPKIFGLQFWFWIVVICTAFSLSDVTHQGWIHVDFLTKPHNSALSSELHITYKLSHFTVKSCDEGAAYYIWWSSYFGGFVFWGTECVSFQCI